MDFDARREESRAGSHRSWSLLSFVKKMGELDPYLSGWPWTAGAFSWVEPTSYSLIALKKLKPDAGRDQLSRQEFSRAKC